MESMKRNWNRSYILKYQLGAMTSLQDLAGWDETLWGNAPPADVTLRKMLIKKVTNP